MRSIYKFALTRNCMANYKVVPPDGSNKARFNELVSGWWNWVYTPNCDDNCTDSKLGVCFLRDDIIGTQFVLKAGISATPSDLQQCHSKNVTVNSENDIFLPIYHVCSVVGHPYVKGGKIKSIAECQDAARIDLSNLYLQWAKITANGGQSSDIVNDLQKHYFESDEFTLNVNGPSDLNREQGFDLDKGRYQGVAFGTYLLLKDFQPGSYQLDFGGKATDYRTRSVYNLTIK